LWKPTVPAPPAGGGQLGPGVRLAMPHHWLKFRQAVSKLARLSVWNAYTWPSGRPGSAQDRASTRPGISHWKGGVIGVHWVAGSSMSRGSRWMRGATPGASVGTAEVVGVALWLSVG
jgi:hypothetical protein